jgi:hypothetical protein
MFASVLIIGFSIVLLVYWFRYSCVLLLRNAAESRGAVADSRFSFGEVQRGLENGADLDPLHRSLNRDYQVLKYLVEHASGLELATVEDRLLVADYKLMQWGYRLTRTFFPGQARQALSEMASILEILIRRMSEQAGLHSEG